MASFTPNTLATTRILSWLVVASLRDQASGSPEERAQAKGWLASDDEGNASLTSACAHLAALEQCLMHQGAMPQESPGLGTADDWRDAIRTMSAAKIEQHMTALLEAATEVYEPSAETTDNVPIERPFNDTPPGL